MIGHYSKRLLVLTTYMTADLHIGHQKILGLCKRPFASIDEMNVELVQRWNAVIQPGDSIWVLGDFAWYGSEDVFHQLKGEKHLIVGNHDTKRTLKMPWASVHDYHELSIHENGVKTKVILFHYGIRSWNGMFKGTIHLHGHSHSRLPGFRVSSGGGTMDVGVDCWDFRPVCLADVQTRLATLPLYSPEGAWPHEPE